MTALDFENQLCGPERCSTQRGKRIMYRNENHLSVAGALTFTRAFYREIAAHARPLADPWRRVGDDDMSHAE